MKTEDFLDALKEYIEDNFSTFLALETGSLPDFKNIEIGGRDPFDCKKYPTLMIHLSDESPEWESLTSIESEIRIDIAISIVNPKVDTAHRYQLRYAEALKDMFAADPTMGNIALIAGLENIRHYPPGAGGQGGPAVSVFDFVVRL